MIKILIVGLGGIGSWTIHKLDWLIKQDQFSVEVHGYDFDTVEEKNTRYQHFFADDLYENKAAALDIRYDTDPRWFFPHEEKVIDSSVFEGYDLVVSAVDNLKFRKIMYDECEPFWIDLRSKGRTIVAITKHKVNTPEVLAKYLAGDMESSGSCQFQSDLDAGRVQLGNQIIADIGAQLILNWTRGEPLAPTFIHMF